MATRKEMIKLLRKWHEQNFEVLLLLTGESKVIVSSKKMKLIELNYSLTTSSI